MVSALVPGTKLSSEGGLSGSRSRMSWRIERNQLANGLNGDFITAQPAAMPTSGSEAFPDRHFRQRVLELALRLADHEGYRFGPGDQPEMLAEQHLQAVQRGEVFA